MAKITDLQQHRRQAPQRLADRDRAGTRFVACAQCGERHPLVRLAGGATRCVTAFEDDGRWFCRNRGCRADWLARQEG
jgi:hypothetical protein